MQRRLVGWWVGTALCFTCLSARAQSTAAFPPENPPPAPHAAPARAPSKPPPKPSSKPAPSPAKSPSPAPATHAGKHSKPVQPASPAPAVAPPPVVTPSPVVTPPPAPAATTDTRPPVLPYYEGMPVPPGYKVVTRPATGVIAGGGVGLAASYGTALIFAAAKGFENASGWLAVPIVGPWLAITERTYPQCTATMIDQARRCVNRAVHEVEYITFVAVDGVFQLATGFLLLAGFLSSKDELIRNDLVPKVSFVAPTPGRREWALSVQGRF